MPKLEKMTPEEKKILRIGFILLFTAAVLVLVIVKFDTLSQICASLNSSIGPFIAGIIIAYILNLFVIFFENIAFKPINKRSKNSAWINSRRPLAVLLSIMVVILLGIFIFLYLIPGIAKSFSTLVSTAQRNWPQTINEFRLWLTDILENSNLDLNLNEIFLRFNWTSIFEKISEYGSDIINSVYSMTVNLASAVISTIISFIFSIYFLFGKEKLQRNMKSLMYAFLPKRAADKAQITASIINESFFSFFKGQLLECVIIGVLCYAGMLVLRFDYPLLISSIIGITALIPIFGAYIGALLGAAILLLVNPMGSVGFLIYIIILQQLDNNIIYPRVVGSSIGLPAIWTIFAIMIWGSLFGIPGILIGTPMTAAFYKILGLTTKRKLSEKGIDEKLLESPVSTTADSSKK